MSFFEAIRRWMEPEPETEPALVTDPPWHLNWVFCREKRDDETAESAQEIECAGLWIHTN